MTDGSSCCNQSTSGPGYKSPLDAFQNGPREKILFVTTVNTRLDQPDALVVVDVNPESPNYSTVISRLSMPNLNDELHHSGWNSCSSCFGDSSITRNKLILPCLKSDRIYVVDTSDPSKLILEHTIDDLKSLFKVSAPHTVHCLPSKEIAISCMGDEEGDNKGSILLIDAKSFRVKGFWSHHFVDFGYDFWYQPKHNVLVSSEWGSPKAWLKGFNLEDVKASLYGRCLNFYDWTTKRHIQTLDLGPDGLLPLEVRFLHNPDQCHGFVGCALSSSVFHFYKNETGKWKADKVIQVESKKVANWMLDEMPGIITDIILSLEDKYLFISNWVQGDIRQYNVEDPFNPVLVASIFLGGSLCNDTGVKLIDEPSQLENNNLNERPCIGDTKIRGGPQMLQLSLDGKRLYVTNSLYSAWDKQFYPELLRKGSLMLQVDVDNVNHKLSLNSKFFIDFEKEPGGPMLAHEMRYPGGDCTSDIWL